MSDNTIPRLVLGKFYDEPEYETKMVSSRLRTNILVGQGWEVASESVKGWRGQRYIATLRKRNPRWKGAITNPAREISADAIPGNIEVQTAVMEAPNAGVPATPPRPRHKAGNHVLLYFLTVGLGNIAYGLHIRHQRRLWDWRYGNGQKPGQVSAAAPALAPILAFGLMLGFIFAMDSGAGNPAGAAEGGQPAVTAATPALPSLTRAEQQELDRQQRELERSVREAIMQQAFQSREVTRPMPNMHFFVYEMSLDLEVDRQLASDLFFRIYDDYVNRRGGTGEMDFFLFTPQCEWSAFGTTDARGRIDFGRLEATGWRNDNPTTPC